MRPRRKHADEHPDDHDEMVPSWTNPFSLWLALKLCVAGIDVPDHQKARIERGRKRRFITSEKRRDERGSVEVQEYSMI